MNMLFLNQLSSVLLLFETEFITVVNFKFCSHLSFHFLAGELAVLVNRHFFIFMKTITGYLCVMK